MSKTCGVLLSTVFCLMLLQTIFFTGSTLITTSATPKKVFFYIFQIKFASRLSASFLKSLLLPITSYSGRLSSHARHISCKLVARF